MNGYPAYSSRTAVSLSGSPFVLTNTASVPIEVFISGGTPSLVEFSRDQVSWDGCGALGGQFKLNPADSLRITYVLAPTIVSYPF